VKLHRIAFEPNVAGATIHAKAFAAPQGEFACVISVGFVFTTDANVANRQMEIRLGRTPGTVLPATATKYQTASNVVPYGFVVGGVNNWNGAASYTFAEGGGNHLPKYVFESGCNVSLVVTNVQAGDAMSNGEIIMVSGTLEEILSL